MLTDFLGPWYQWWYIPVAVSLFGVSQLFRLWDCDINDPGPLVYFHVCLFASIFLTLGHFL